MSDDDVEGAEKRAHHNALERKRRDHIKDSFNSLRDAVPSLQSEKSVSRAQILKKAADYIQLMRKKNYNHQQDIGDLKRQNNLLEAQIRTLERNVNIISPNTQRFVDDLEDLDTGSSDSSSGSEDNAPPEATDHITKKMKCRDDKSRFW